MIKLWACLKKDIRIISRDKVGLALLFLMPIILVVVITSVQNSAFEVVNDNKIKLLLSNHDEGRLGQALAKAIEQMGLFEMHQAKTDEKDFSDALFAHDAMVGILIPSGFSQKEQTQADHLVNLALADLGLNERPTQANGVDSGAITITTIRCCKNLFVFPSTASSPPDCKASKAN
ncbi:MAG: ABC transporter permease [Cyclobacteriaceae bacterium]|nr:ABC transporter permease [Cyclobacteriaceae bacterium]